MKIVGAMIYRAVRDDTLNPQRYAADFVLAIHDEFVLDVELPLGADLAKDPAAAWFEFIIQVVEQQLNDLLQWPVRVELDFGSGHSWAEAH